MQLMKQSHFSPKELSIVFFITSNTIIRGKGAKFLNKFINLKPAINGKYIVYKETS